MPHFTVILPFHNAASTLGATLNSLRAQSFCDWEAICIDDGGTDTSRQIAEHFAREDRRIKVVTNTGTGPSDARNFGSSLARGVYLAFLDADDLWTSNKLATLAAGFADSGADALFARIGFFEETPDQCTAVSRVSAQALSIRDLLAENPVCTLSNLAMKTAAFHTLGGFKTDIIHNEDLELLIRCIGEGYRVEPVDAVLVWYRTNPNGLSANTQAMLDSRRRVIDTALRYGVCPSRADDAVYLRYLARRALRLHAPHTQAWAYAREGLRSHPLRFLTPLRRGAPTALAAALVRCVPAAGRMLRG